MRIITLFNLKPGVAATDYEAWAQTRDLPGVRSLVSVADFDVYRTTGLLSASDPAPYDYVEVLDVLDMEGFEKDWAGDLMQSLVDEMRAYADDVMFMTTERISVA